MTRTWMSLPERDLFAVAGIWRGSDEWGDCYSMIMTDAAGGAVQVHNRMPVILEPASYDRWRSGTVDEAKALFVPYIGPLSIDQTSES